MIGTIFSQTDARRCTPPRKINPQITTSTSPATHPGIPNAVSIVDPIELDCTIHPINPSARIIATAKNPAKNFPNPPLNAVVM